MLYEDRLASEEPDDWYMDLTQDYVLSLVVPKVREAIKEFGCGYGAKIHTREIEALIMLVQGRL